MLTSGSRPNTATLGTTTPNCAPSVTPIGRANNRVGSSSPRRRAIQGPALLTPSVAPTDNQNPTDHTNSGSTRTSPVTATARIRTGPRSRPSTNAVAESPAITPARTIDGSNRVRATNQAMRPMLATHRPQGRRRRSSGPLAARRKETF